MKYNLLWIDDIRCPKHGKWRTWIANKFPGIELDIFWVTSYEEAVLYIEKYGLPDIVCFDHDLGDIDNPNGEKTGYDCCKFMVDYCLDNNCKFPAYAIQSDNSPGAENINRYIQNFNKFCSK